MGFIELTKDRRDVLITVRVNVSTIIYYIPSVFQSEGSDIQFVSHDMVVKETPEEIDALIVDCMRYNNG